MKTSFAACAVATLLAFAAGASAADDFEHAMQLYDNGQYSLALPPLQAAARGGQPVSRYMECALRHKADRTAARSRLRCFDWIAAGGDFEPG